MAELYPEIAPLRDLRQILQDFQALRELPIGRDNRNRTNYWPFSTSTGRNCPRGSEFLFALAAWTRGLIRPEPSQALVHLDYCNQEFAIAGYLSGDSAMVAAYESGRDPYLELGCRIGMTTPGATKKTHPAERKVLKIASLATIYGQQAEGLAHRIGWPVPQAHRLLEDIWRTYPRLKRWLEGAVDYAVLRGELHTCFGWRVLNHPETKITTLMNFLVQAHAAEMMRWACGLAVDRGLQACCPIHDAMLLGESLDRAEDLKAAATRAMQDASAIVLDGPRLAVDAEAILWPNRFQDDDGWDTWRQIMEMVGPIEGEDTRAELRGVPVRNCGRFSPDPCGIAAPV
jgi:hypothetical protein